MVIKNSKKLVDALKSIEYNHQNTNNDSDKYYQFLIHELEEVREEIKDCSIIKSYGDSKWEIVEILNQKYNKQFNLHNWISHNKEDEVAYFLNETGSNALNYSQFRCVSKFHLWLGNKGFIVGVEQKGEGFNALKINKLGLKENQGAGFEFFRSCKSNIFFDNSKEVRIVFMEYLKE